MTLTCSILITNYNTWTLTNRCIQAVSKWSQNKIHQILIVDDASTENAPDFFSEQVKIVYNEENRGYVASVNRGFLELQEDIIILFDSDAYPLMDLTETVREAFANNPKLGAVGFQLVDEEGNPTGSYDTIPKAIELLLGQALTARLHSWLPNQNKSVICLYSCAMAVRLQAFQGISGFDEGFDFLDADIDFSMRLQQSGWQVQVIPELLVFHEGGGSPQSTAKRVLRHHKNRWRLLSKHNLLIMPNLLKFGLATRHALEYLLLKTCGHFVIREPTKLQDKLYSRKELSRLVWSNYDNKF